MKLQICPPSALEATDVQASKDGLLLRPLFYGSGREASGAIVRVLGDDGTLLSLAVLKINGETGKVILQDRTMPVMPLMERKESEPGSAAKGPSTKGG